jgi:hypothetical protein
VRQSDSIQACKRNFPAPNPIFHPPTTKFQPSRIKSRLFRVDSEYRRWNIWGEYLGRRKNAGGEGDKESMVVWSFAV